MLLFNLEAVLTGQPLPAVELPRHRVHRATIIVAPGDIRRNNLIRAHHQREARIITLETAIQDLPGKVTSAVPGVDLIPETAQEVMIREEAVAEVRLQAAAIAAEAVGRAQVPDLRAGVIN